MKRVRSPFRPLMDLRVPGLKITEDRDITNETSMRMRCVAGAFAEVGTCEALEVVLHTANREGIPAFLLGRGQNTLFASSHFDGLVYKLTGEFQQITDLGDGLLRVGSGVSLNKLQVESKRMGLMGVEFLTRVPGTVGGALAGNAGAGNWGMCDLADRVFSLTRQGQPVFTEHDEIHYSYRHSDLRKNIILYADLQMLPLEPRLHDELVQMYRDKKKNQPVEERSSGCIFKNPGKIDGRDCYAGQLIDEAQLKGYYVRSAQISDRHANFMINRGDASGEDFLALINLARDIVHHRTGVELQPEVQIVGGPLNSAVLI